MQHIGLILGFIILFQLNTLFPHFIHLEYSLNEMSVEDSLIFEI